MNMKSFQPAGILKNPYIQSILASKRPGGLFSKELQSSTQTITLECNNNVKLSGSYSMHPLTCQKGCFLLLHGWEGSSDSRYIRSATQHLFNQHYSIFRLNLRDHGNSYHLNEGLFFVTLFDEVFQAISLIAEQVNAPIYIAGYSLGGNFALRIALQHSKTPVKGLKKILSINPPIHPELSTDRIDHIPLFRYYFLKKWIQSLKKKQSLFPHLYQLNDIFQLKTIRDVTEALVDKHSNYKNASDYFSRYTLLGDTLKDVTISTTIMTAKDDPIIDVADFYDLCKNEHIHMMIHPYGGHIGYIEGFRLFSWIDHFLPFWAANSSVTLF